MYTRCRFALGRSHLGPEAHLGCNHVPTEIPFTGTQQAQQRCTLYSGVYTTLQPKAWVFHLKILSSAENQLCGSDFRARTPPVRVFILSRRCTLDSQRGVPKREPARARSSSSSRIWSLTVARISERGIHFLFGRCFWSVFQSARLSVIDPKILSRKKGPGPSVGSFHHRRIPAATADTCSCTAYDFRYAFGSCCSAPSGREVQSGPRSLRTLSE